MRESSRFIPGESINAVALFDFDPVDTRALLLAQQAKDADESLIRARAEEARQIGFEDGFSQGRAHAAREAEQKINDYINGQGEDTARAFARRFEQANAQLDEAQQVIAHGVLELACEVARQVLRQELLVNPGGLQSVVREALRMLIADGKSARIKVNPQDIEALQNVLQAEFATLAISVSADASVSRGGCIVESAGTVVDGSMQSRWTRAIANLGLTTAWVEVTDDQ